MIVLKFGGTSVQDAGWIDRAIDIASGQLDRAPLMVSSAMGKTTDRLVELMNQAEAGRAEEAFETLTALRTAHEETAQAFLSGAVLEETQEQLEDLLRGLTSLTQGLSLLRECSPRSTDAVLSYGERLSTLLIAARCRERGIPAILHDARRFMITDATYGRAEPIWETVFKRTREEIVPRSGTLHITQGFIGADTEGVTTTLGRGGSDYTAAALGAALEAEEVQIWTDVNGIMTSDPRLVSAARPLPCITYDEAAELAYFGAKVVHPSTIQPAITHRIPVYVRSTRQPDEPGTRIQADAEVEGLRAISAKKEITLVTIRSSRMLNAYGFLQRLFAVFEKYATPVDLISTSEVSVSMSVEDTSRLEEITEELGRLGDTGVEHGLSIICLVGQNLWRDSRFIAQVFQSLADTPIRMVSLGSSDTNLSLMVPEDHRETTVRRLHGAFFPDSAGGEA